ncbi:MAG: DMT family transporter [Candidatus Nezhaarchaeales archaeon]
MIRIIFAIVAGMLSALINPMLLNLSHHGVIASFLPVLIAILLYIVSYYFVRDLIKISPSSLNEPSYMYKGGALTYIFVWLVTWSIIATLCFPSLIQ